VAQPLLDEYPMARLRGIRIQAGKDQQADLALPVCLRIAGSSNR
jgi:hypothetical protein